MTVPTLQYPVHTLAGEELLPAGAVLSDETMAGLMSRARMVSRNVYPFMKHGSVRRDMLELMDSGPYRTIFSLQERTSAVLNLIEKLLLPGSVLDALDYFKHYDPYTYRHTLLVCVLSTFLSQDLLPNPRDPYAAVAFGPTHDFGKICIPLEILTKKYALTLTERKNIEHHTLAGYVLLSYYYGTEQRLPAKVARDHHERNDGSGYPRGVRLSDHVVEIAAVSDLYDALISPRPYRPTSYTNRAALDEIVVLGRKDQLSWEVVQALVAHNRKSRPPYNECRVSSARRDLPPDDNAYGVVLLEDAETGPASEEADPGAPEP